MKKQGMIKQADFIEFVDVLRYMFGEKDADNECSKTLADGAYLRELFTHFIVADINDIMSNDDKTLETYLRNRGIYGKSGIANKLLKNMDKEYFAGWIQNEEKRTDSFQFLLMKCMSFVEKRPDRFAKLGDELLKYAKIETLGMFITEIFVIILSAPDPERAEIPDLIPPYSNEGSNTHDAVNVSSSCNRHAERALFSSSVYQNIVNEISDLRCDLKEMSQDNPRRKKKMETLNLRQSELIELKSAVLDIFRQIQESPIESKQISTVWKLFEQGNFSEADALFDEEDLQHDLQVLQEQEQHVRQEQEVNQKGRIDLAMQYVLKAKIRLTQLYDNERFDKAEALYNTAITISRTPLIMYEYGHFLVVNRGFHDCEKWLDKAISLLDEALNALAINGKENKMLTINILFDLASAYQTRPDKMEVTATTIMELLFGESQYLMHIVYNNYSLMAMNNSASALLNAGKVYEAEKLLSQLVEMCDKIITNSPGTIENIFAMALYNFALSHRQCGKIDQAITEYKRAIIMCNIWLQHSPDDIVVKEYKAQSLANISYTLVSRCFSYEILNQTVIDESEKVKYHKEGIDAVIEAIDIYRELMKINPLKYEHMITRHKLVITR